MNCGDQYAAALSQSTILPSMDFETYSEAGYYWDGKRWQVYKKGKPGIGCVGAWVYSRHPSAEAICLVYDLKDGFGRRLWRPIDLHPPLDLFAWIDGGGLIEATNSFFEFCVWENVCRRLYDWPPLPLSQLRDVAAKSGSWSLPRELEAVAKILGTPTQKDKAGNKIMKKISKPHTPTKKEPFHKYTRENAPADFAAIEAYCGDDVAAEDEVSVRCPDLSPRETEYFLCDQRINARGVRVDRQGVMACIDLIAQAKARAHAEISELTGGLVTSSDQVPSIKKFLAASGVQPITASLDKDALPRLLAGELPPTARRVLEVRTAMNSKSVEKVHQMAWRLDPEDDRIRGLYTYCGATRTWRWAGGGPQAQNLPAGVNPKVQRCDRCGRIRWVGLGLCPRCYTTPATPTGWGIEGAEACLEAIMTRSLDHVEAMWGDALTAIAGCLRSLFIAGPGMELISADFNAIEAVILAELAGEAWRQEVFRTHGKIYEMSASKISGVPFDEFERYRRETGSHHPLRAKLGKTGDLSSGYGGWINAWHNFGAHEYMNDDEIKAAILLWRHASPAIVNYWDYLERAALDAVEYPGTSFAARSVRYQTHGNTLYCHLPSGRAIPYHQPEIIRPEGERTLRYSKLFKQKVLVWERAYRSLYVLNVTQATARDRFAHSMPLLERAGYPIVMHTHDEFTAEVPLGCGSVEEVESIMGTAPEWAADWPVRASGGWRGQRYRKD